MLKLSTGQEVSAGTLKWRAYKQIKQAFIGKIGGSLQGLLAGLGDTSNRWEQLQRVGQSLLPVVAETLDELHEIFLQGCASIELDFSKLSIADVKSLFEICLEANPLESFLELEKNSLAGAVATRVLQETSLPASASGTQDSNASLYDPAGD